MTVGKQERVECLHFKDRAGPENYVYFKFLDPEKNSFEFAQLVEERGGRESVKSMNTLGSLFRAVIGNVSEPFKGIQGWPKLRTVQIPYNASNSLGISVYPTPLVLPTPYSDILLWGIL